MVPAIARICWDAELVPEGGSMVACGCAAPIQATWLDAAGHSFHAAALKQAGVHHAKDEEEDSNAAESERGSEFADPEFGAWMDSSGADGKRKKKVKKDKGGRADLYALLGLQHLRWMATDKQIKDAYRKAALAHHPDKTGAATADASTKERLEEQFKSIQSAYETLCDPVKRREFDSTDDFDDSLPSDCAAGEFFKVFGAAFMRQSRWSVAKPVPTVGDEKTPWDKVNAFYDFWYSFKSWREFPHPDEEDVEQAESREERRWIERFNSKLREKGKKDESKRLRAFVDNAYKLDPRVIAHKEEQRLARERRKREKIEALQRAQREEEEKQAAEKAAREAEEAAAKAAAAEAKQQRQEEKRMLRKERSRLRNTFGFGENAAAANGIAVAADAAGVNEDDKEEREKAAKARATAAKLARGGQADLQAKLANMTEWSPEEMRMLDKALNKFPVGTAKRWDQVVAYVRTRTMDEVLLMVKSMQGAGAARLQSQDWRSGRKQKGAIDRQNAATAPSVDDDAASSTTANGATAAAAADAAAESWSEEQEMALVKALKTHSKDLSDRWERISAVVPGKNKAQCFKRFKELRENFRSKK